MYKRQAQTIAKPAAYFKSLRQKEKKVTEHLEEEDRPRVGLERVEKKEQASVTTEETSALSVTTDQDLFPIDMLDAHGEQLDLRLRNSWTLNLDEVKNMKQFHYQLGLLAYPVLKRLYLWNSGAVERAPAGADREHGGPVPPNLAAEDSYGGKPPRPQIRGQCVRHGGSVLPTEQGPPPPAHQHG